MRKREIAAIRRQRLKELVRQVGSQTEVARLGGTDASYLSQILGDGATRNLGSRLARRLEGAFGKPPGWMDESVHSDMTRVVFGEGPILEGFSLVPHYRAEASMGRGADLPDEESLIGHLAFKNVWLEKRRLNPRYLTLVDAVGDSMFPTIADGDLLLVDLRQTEPVDNRIFVLRMERQLYAKRLLVHSNRHVTVQSDNPAAPPFDIDMARESGMEIVGRVVWAGKNF